MKKIHYYSELFTSLLRRESHILSYYAGDVVSPAGSWLYGTATHRHSTEFTKIFGKQIQSLEVFFRRDVLQNFGQN